MIEEALLNYGVLGVWTISLLYERFKTQGKMQNLVENNTKALVKVYEVIDKCPKAKHL
jgi:hypothetical protein